MPVKKPKTKSRKLLLLSVVVIIIAAAGIAGGIYYKKRYNKTPTPATPEPTETINYTPTTEKEKADVQANKEKIVQDQNASSPVTGSNGKKQVVPTITNASSTSISSYVSGVFEDGGTCTATAQQGSQKITKTSSGFQNVSYTQCAPINWDSPLSSGSWVVSLAYSSPTTEGSTQTTIEVQ